MLGQFAYFVGHDYVVFGFLLFVMIAKILESFVEDVDLLKSKSKNNVADP